MKNDKIRNKTLPVCDCSDSLVEILHIDIYVALASFFYWFTRIILRISGPRSKLTRSI